MSENNKPTSYEDLYQMNLKKDAESKQRMEKIRKDTIERLKTDPAIQQYLSHYNPIGIDSFITHYAHQLMMTLEFGNMYATSHEEQSTEYLKKAENCLKEIQLKKLFDLRCQWGANLIKFEGVDIYFEFNIDNMNLLNSKIVSPISQEEFDLYMMYANSVDFYLNEYEIDWSYISDKRTYHVNEEGVELPAWFIYHNTYTNSSTYMMLPDVRYDMEKKYRDLFFENQIVEDAKSESAEIKEHQPNKRPMISDHQYKDVIQFMRKFENAETIRLFENMVVFGDIDVIKDTEEENDSDWLDEQVEEIVSNLQSLGNVKLPVNDNEDWRTALISAWKKFETDKTIAALPAAYDNYLFMIENKIAFANESNDYNEIISTLKNQVLTGRKLNGEPADFNY